MGRLHTSYDLIINTSKSKVTFYGKQLSLTSPIQVYFYVAFECSNVGMLTLDNNGKLTVAPKGT